jgi:hypothetical protein
MNFMIIVRSLFRGGVRRLQSRHAEIRYRPEITALEGRWLPATITEFPLPPLTFNPVPATLGITGGPDGNVWFTEPITGAVGRITPAGQVTEFPTPVNDPIAITAGPDGNLWFTGGSLTDGSIGRITPAGQVTKFALPERFSRASGIAAGPDGNLWFTESIYPSGEKVGRITPSGQLTQFTIAVPSGVVGSIGAITAGARRQPLVHARRHLGADQSNRRLHGSRRGGWGRRPRCWPGRQPVDGRQRGRPPDRPVRQQLHRPDHPDR